MHGDTETLKSMRLCQWIWIWICAYIHQDGVFRQPNTPLAFLAQIETKRLKELNDRQIPNLLLLLLLAVAQFDRHRTSTASPLLVPHHILPGLHSQRRAKRKS